MTDATSDQMRWELDQIKFWLWAAIHDGEAYIEADARATALSRDVFASSPTEVIKNYRENYPKAQHKADLEKYHFVVVIGMVLRALKHSESKFPGIKPAIRSARHLFKERKELRDMIEHQDDYLEGRGKHQGRFMRELHPISGFPRSMSPGIADATSVIVDDKGHWLGGR